MATIYGYNSNTSTQTYIVNGVAYTQNVTTIGNSGSCSSTSTCADGYALYFPCIKKIIRGENVCLDFYVVSQATNDVIDLRELDALTVELTGQFGCSSGTFTYPDDITFLQEVMDSEVLNVSFDDYNREIHKVTVTAIDENDEDSDDKIIIDGCIDGKYGNFYETDTDSLSAYDTYYYKFLNWDIKFPNNEDENGILEDNVLEFTVGNDAEVSAIYQKKPVHRLTCKTENAYATVYLSDTDEGTILDYNCGIDVVEGEVYHIEMTAHDGHYYPEENKKYLEGTMGEDDVEIYSEPTFNVSKEEEKFEHKYETSFNVYPDSNLVENELNYETEEFLNPATDWFDDEIFSYTESVFAAFTYKNACVLFGEDHTPGRMTLETFPIKKDFVLSLSAKCAGVDSCGIRVFMNGIKKEAIVSSSDEFEYISFDFTAPTSEEATIEIMTFPTAKGRAPKCFIDNIVVERESYIENKGMAELCLSSAQTSKLIPGRLTASGALQIDGNIKGLLCSQAAEVSSAKKINVLEDSDDNSTCDQKLDKANKKIAAQEEIIENLEENCGTKWIEPEID